ncbi:hypothetical protein HLH14_11765 [Acinetobacter sp. ANC 4282]|uniref:hypothetical protein n=1 Tax=Acinetobacter terrae TaxID=2731247 RepID=UPI00148FF330|nr:hypothetical protein [Acinetobacter terrae]NNH16650.1 hypothetical protein [Acinetobacter terrae]
MTNNSLIVRNSIFLAMRTIVISIVGLFSVRELLVILGAEEYGLFNLVFGVAALFAFINGAMVLSTQRYLSYYIGKKNNQLFEDVWSSSLFLHLLIAVTVSVILLSLKNLMLNRVLSIDLSYIKSANFVFYFAVISIFISIFQAPFNALILAKEKMSFYAGLSLYDAVSKLGIIYCLYFMQEPLLEKYTVLYVSSSLVVFVIYALYCYKKFNKKIQLKVSNFPLLKGMFFYSSWNIFGNFAAVAKIQGVNILLNIFFGVVLNSAYAIANTVTGIVGGLINTITIASNPQVYKSYAEGDNDRNILLIHTISKFSFFFCLLVILPILFNTQYLLKLWLHDFPSYLTIFLQMALVALLIESLSGVLMTAVQATGNVKKYQIVLGFIIFLNLPISYFALKVFTEALVVYWVSILISIICLLFRMVFLKNLLNFKVTFYLKNVILKISLVTIASVMLALFFKNNINLSNDFLSFIFLSFTIIISVLISILFLGLNKIERNYILLNLKKYMK